MITSYTVFNCIFTTRIQYTNYTHKYATKHTSN